MLAGTYLWDKPLGKLAVCRKAPLRLFVRPASHATQAQVNGTVAHAAEPQASLKTTYMQLRKTRRAACLSEPHSTSLFLISLVLLNAMAGHGQPWPVLVGHGRPWRALAGLVRPWPAFVLAVADHGRP